MAEHGLAGLFADQSFPVDASQSRSISAAVVLPRPNFLLRSATMDVSRRKTLEWIFVWG